jgi:hypothetical protein
VTIHETSSFAGTLIMYVGGGLRGSSLSNALNLCHICVIFYCQFCQRDPPNGRRDLRRDRPVMALPG